MVGRSDHDTGGRIDMVIAASIPLTLQHSSAVECWHTWEMLNQRGKSTAGQQQKGENGYTAARRFP